MKKIEYILEIYKPKSTKDVWVEFKSSQPFISFNVGDIINPGTWVNTKSPMVVLKISTIEYLIWETEKVIKQKIMVFSKEVGGTENLRLGQ